MTQSTLPFVPRPDVPSGLRIGIIMDGNGRWAAARGRPRTVGHRVGARAVRRIVEAAAERDVGVLTLYAFSADNWQRPDREVRTLMRLFRAYLAREQERCVENGIRLEVIGRRDRLAPELRERIETVEAATAAGGRMILRLAVDYSAREAILRAAALAAEEGRVPREREEFAHYLGRAIHASGPVPDLDLLVRTGGEKRLSDFLLWEAAYAEIVFTDRMWPEFGPADLDAALAEFRRRERRFGGLPDAADARDATAPPELPARAVGS